jgi:hypothetical protein
VSTASKVGTVSSSIAVGIGQALVSTPVTSVSAGTTQIKATLNNTTITGTVRVCPDQQVPVLKPSALTHSLLHSMS